MMMRDDSIQQFDSWRQQIVRQLKQLRLWLRRNQMFSPETDQRLTEVLAELEQDYLTVAFAGEFSRGKTELINALFFADYGRRVLPSDAGRTTMCPTELYFDRVRNAAYLRLLPIETRLLQDRSLQDCTEDPSLWIEHPLNVDSVEDLTEALRHTAQTQWVTREEALRLGFAEAHQSREDNEGRVEIPRWRHALVSFPHPLLRQGLRIIDTPGLNALGSEPELTLSLLPRAQAIVFVLAADTGVTASDMQVWEQAIAPIRNRPHLGVFALLNKVDSLWDELKGEQGWHETIERMRKLTAQQLGLKDSDVLPVSAKQGLLGRIQGNDRLLQRSGLEAVDRLLSHELLQNKRQAFWIEVTQDAAHLVEEGLHNLRERKAVLSAQYRDLEKIREHSREDLDRIIRTLEKETRGLHRQLQTMAPSRRLLEQQARSLNLTLSPEALERHLSVARQRMVSSATSMSLIRSMRQLNEQILAMFDEFVREAELANKMAEAVYRKYERSHGVAFLQPRPLEAKRMRRELHRLMKEQSRWHQMAGVLVTEQSALVRRFFNGHVQNVARHLAECRRSVGRWAQKIVFPIEQQIRARKRLVDQHLDQLHDIRRKRSTIGGQLTALTNMMREVDDELFAANRTLQLLARAAYAESGNVVPLNPSVNSAANP
jgi:hypothetical protein